MGAGEHLSPLRDHGCPEGQGNYFSRPVPAAKFTHLLLPQIAQGVAA